MNGWDSDKAWSDGYLDEIKSILGIYLIGEPPVEEDQDRNTDLIVLKMDAVRVGCRIRRNTFYENDKYRYQFTVREKRPSGAKTELTKVVEGWGDYFFYGFGGKDGLLMWTLCDLKVFRIRLMRHLCETGELLGESLPNRDGSSRFRVFSWFDFPRPFIVGCSWINEEGKYSVPTNTKEQS